MKHLFHTLILALVSTTYGFAQNQIIVEDPNNNTYLLPTLDSAVVFAPAGSTIYLPGGGFDAPTDPIDKEIHIIGVGHYPDSTSATGRTHINGRIELTTGSSYSTFDGFYLSGEFYFGIPSISDNSVVTNIVLINLNISSINAWNNYSGEIPSLINNILLMNSVVRGGIGFYGSRTLTIRNCIISGFIFECIDCTALNSIFLAQDDISAPYYRVFHNCQNAIIENNIFLFEIGPASGNYFASNNLGANGNELGWNNEQSINSYYEGPDNTFINLGDSYSVFEYEDDYHLQSGSLANGNGTGGTDIGIYGGDTPYKEGAVPHNPHIQVKNISTVTDPTGNLQIQIQVQAQDN